MDKKALEILILHAHNALHYIERLEKRVEEVEQKLAELEQQLKGADNAIEYQRVKVEGLRRAWNAQGLPSQGEALKAP
jgi:chromosome segregation ATPase